MQSHGWSWGLSWSTGSSLYRQSAREIGLELAREIKELHSRLTALHHLDGDASAIRGQAEAFRLAAIRHRQAQQLAGGPVFQDGHPFRSLLHEGGDVAPVPAERWGAVGLMAAQMAQWNGLAAWLLLKHHHGFAALFQHRCQKTTIAADGGVLTIFGPEGTERTHATSAEQANSGTTAEACHQAKANGDGTSRCFGSA